MPADEDQQLTIDQLAQHTGMTVRNIRAHQARGLLPPPQVRGRTGYYGTDHIARIELIRELQGDGYNLDLIRKLLGGAAGQSTEVLRFTRTLRAPFFEEEPQIVTAAELAERFQTEDPALIKRAEELGILRRLDDEGRYEEISPSLTSAGAELVALGVPASQALEVLMGMRRHADSVAKSFAKLFIESVWQPFAQEGAQDEQWSEVSAALERLRPLASQSLLAIFQIAMTDVVEQELGKELERLTHKGSGRRRGR
ncbi:MAG: MerR family transcriptional regulator [Solirubrobacterales bacterium]|jgi:DNA-binding transcriptional MerR regulator|nr:MerR family transcriptional regulator [Solirubrobacterales bacterium]